MAQILFRKEKSDFEKLTPQQINVSDDLKEKLVITKGEGCGVEIQNDFYFATPENPKGRGWRGDIFALIEIPGMVKNHKDLKIFFENYNCALSLSTKTETVKRLKYIFDVTKLPAPYVWQFQKDAPDRYIYYIVDPKAIEKIDRESIPVSFQAVK